MAVRERLSGFERERARQEQRELGKGVLSTSGPSLPTREPAYPLALCGAFDRVRRLPIRRLSSFVATRSQVRRICGGKRDRDSHGKTTGRHGPIKEARYANQPQQAIPRGRVGLEYPLEEGAERTQKALTNP